MSQSLRMQLFHQPPLVQQPIQARRQAERRLLNSFTLPTVGNVSSL